jgi:hypothetical protein
MPDEPEEEESAPRSHPYMLGDESDFTFVDGQDGAPEDDDDEEPDTADLVFRARALLNDAANEAQPIDGDRYQALVSEVEFICFEADEPDDVRKVVAPELSALNPE